jgi:hypothetical protein
VRLHHSAGVLFAGREVFLDQRVLAHDTIENNVAIAFGAPSANWGVIAGWTSNDAATAGNAWDWSVLATPKTVNNGDAAPSFPASAMSIQIDA